MAATTLQTLDRGLAVLAALAESPLGLKPAELAQRLDVHKAIAYRLVATLELHGLVRRLSDGRVVLGAGLIPLAAKVETHRLTAAMPHLSALSEATRTTSCIVLANGPEAVVAAVHEGGDGFLRVTYRLGMRHPLTRGATGLAILSGRPPVEGELPSVTLARQQGYSLTRGELQQGAIGIAAPIRAAQMQGQAADAAVSIVSLEELPDGAADQVMACARAIEAIW